MEKPIYSPDRSRYFATVLQQDPTACAVISGSITYPSVTGNVRFYQIPAGTLVAAQIFGLPSSGEACGSKIFAFHIHEGTSCDDVNFADTLGHYNPKGCEHPYHAGDMPPLFANNGYAFSVFLTDRFSVSEVLGKTVVIHRNPDDVTSQPAGNAGEKIACGRIERRPCY